jgi:hypothetical protein
MSPRNDSVPSAFSSSASRKASYPVSYKVLNRALNNMEALEYILAYPHLTMPRLHLQDTHGASYNHQILQMNCLLRTTQGHLVDGRRTQETWAVAEKGVNVIVTRFSSVMPNLDLLGNHYYSTVRVDTSLPMLFANGDVVDILRSKVILKPPIHLGNLYLVPAHLPLPHTAVGMEGPVL